MIYFTSDIHFGHANIIKYCNRPFKTVEEMDETIIENWNKKVTEKDEVYFLGDFSFYKSYEKDNELLSRLKGIKYMIRGNHDHKGKLKHVKGWTWIRNVYDLPGSLTPFNNKIVLFHYPMLEWNGSFHGSLHFHGHSHGTKPHSGKNRFDVGVDAWGYSPISTEEIYAYSK